MERWAVLSDIHGNLPALEAVLAEIAAEGIGQVVQLGDALSGPLWPAETAARLMGLGWPAIAGNHERQLLTLPRARQGASDAYADAQLGTPAREWLGALPATRWLTADIFCCHGTPASDLVYFMETGDARSRPARLHRPAAGDGQRARRAARRLPGAGGAVRAHACPAGGQQPGLPHRQPRQRGSAGL